MTEFHHRSSLKQTNKPFKSSHSSKRAQKDKAKGKVNWTVPTKSHLYKAAKKADRRNAAKLAQQKKRQELQATNRIFNGKSGAPKIAAVISLCPDSSIDDALTCLFEAADEKYTASNNTIAFLEIPRFKQKIQLLKCPRQLTTILDAAKVSDYLIFLVSSIEEVDKVGISILSSVIAQNVPQIITLVQRLPSIQPHKKQIDIKKSLSSFMSYWVSEDFGSGGLFDVEDRNECLQALRHITSVTPKKIAWRDRHPYMVVEKVSPIAGENENSKVIDLELSGYARGAPLNPDRLIHIPNYGDFQIAKISSKTASYESEKKAGGEPADIMMNDTAILDENVNLPNPEACDDLVAVNEEDPMEGEQTWPTEEEMAEGDAHISHHLNQRRPSKESFMSRVASTSVSRTKRVPKGTSSYQAAWIIDSDDDADSQYDDDEEHDDANMNSQDHDMVDDVSQSDENEQEEDFENVTLDDRMSVFHEGLDEEEETKQLEEYLAQKAQRRLEDSSTDFEFPDEVDTPLDVPARVRFARYRGLKSFNSSPWDPYENLPMEYSRVFQFENYQRTRSRVMKSAEQDGNAALIGKYVTITVKNVPKEALQFYKVDINEDSKTIDDSNSPSSNVFRLLTVFGCLQYEHKMSVVHFSITRKDPPTTISADDEPEPTSDPNPIRSKDSVILQVGYRRFICNPIYSQDTKSMKKTNDVHKFERFLRIGQTSMGTVYGPITFGPAPILMFRINEDGNEDPIPIGTGSLLPPSPTRIVAKRIILTGHPFKIHKKSAVIRYMFFNPSDIAYFKPVQLATKYGRIGHIKESLGTKGYMKCMFDGPLKMMDTVCLMLYKRVFPKMEVAADESLDETVEQGGDGGPYRWKTENIGGIKAVLDVEMA